MKLLLSSLVLLCLFSIVLAQTMPPLPTTYVMKFNYGTNFNGTTWSLNTTRFRTDQTQKSDGSLSSVLVHQNKTANLTTSWIRSKTAASTFCIKQTQSYTQSVKPLCARKPLKYLGKVTWNGTVTDGWAQNCTFPNGTIYQVYKYFWKSGTNVPFIWQTILLKPWTVYTTYITYFSRTAPPASVFNPFVPCTSMSFKKTREVEQETEEEKNYLRNLKPFTLE